MNNDTPDFANSVDLQETDNGQAIATVTTPDFANSSDISDIVPIKEQRPSMISQVARFLYRDKPIHALESAMYMQDKIPEDIPGESYQDWQKRWTEALQPHEKEIVSGGIGKVFEKEMMAGIAIGAVAHPVGTAFGLAGYTMLDQFINLRRFTDKNFPNTSPEVKDIIEIADFGLKVGLLGGGYKVGKDIMTKRMDNLGLPKNTNISTEQVGKIKDSVNLLPEEKADLLKTLGIEQKHIDTSVNNSIPINISSEKVLDLASKPYWERTKAELGIVPEQPKATEGKVDIQPILENIKSLQKEKNLSNITVSKLKQFIGIENIKKADMPQLEKLQSFLKDLKAEDKFMSEKQITDLKGIIKELPIPEITPKRIIIDKFGEKEEVLSKGIMGKVQNELIPTVNIKEGHPLITKIVNEAGKKMSDASREIDRRNEQLDKMLTKAEKSRVSSLSPQEKLSRKLLPQNKEIFQALSGEKVNLTKDEVAVVAYLKNFFEMARKDLSLDKYRKKYITHIEKDLTEKILTDGVYKAVNSIFGTQKNNDIPINILLELDNIIGSEKFFKYALERKGGIDPSTNIRRIINQYSSLYETKKALDSILPEGQAITNNLLKGKSALWMKQFLQNLKGRGLDNKFKTGKMGWLAKTADGIVNIGYLKLLALPGGWKSALKNLVAGETNSWIYQDFQTYLTGKKRFISNPNKAYKLASEYGILEGTYTDFAEKGLGKFKKAQDIVMVGQKVGEIEIRSSIFSSMLTEKEWETGKVAPENIQMIKDVVAKTQGIFSKIDSPLLLQTWYGRMFFQMNRWRITNAMLLRDIVPSAVKDMKKGNYKTQNVTRLGKMITAYGVGMYISYELSKAGLKTAASVAKNMAQTIDGIASLVTEGDLVKMFTDNPTLSTLKEAGFSAQELAYYLHIPGAKKPKDVDINQGLEDTYIAPVKGVEDILNTISDYK